MRVNNYQTKIQFRKDIGRFIRESRLSTSLTGEELGKKINISQQQISRYENGVTGITIEKLAEILEALGCSWPEFFSEVLMNIEDKYK